MSDAPPSGRPVTINMTENQELVAQLVGVENLKLSVVSASRQLDIDRSLRHNEGLHVPSTTVHGLGEDDGDRLSQFCELFRNKLDGTPELLDHIIWSNQPSNYLAK